MASAWAAGAIGDFGWDLAPSSLAHGVAQGGIAELGGGDFRSGFWAGAIGHAVSGTMQARGNGLMTLGNGGMRGIVARTAIAAVAGGTVSVLGGGKFANGAKTAAFVHLFNAEGMGSLNEQATTEPQSVAGKLMSSITKLKDFMGLGKNPANAPGIIKGAAGKGLGGVAAAGISVLNVDTASAITSLTLRTSIMRNYSNPIEQAELINMMRSDRSKLIQRLRQDAVRRREGE